MYASCDVFGVFGDAQAPPQELINAPCGGG
jgi:hypothetical protein